MSISDQESSSSGMEIIAELARDDVSTVVWGDSDDERDSEEDLLPGLSASELSSRRKRKPQSEKDSDASADDSEQAVLAPGTWIQDVGGIT